MKIKSLSAINFDTLFKAFSEAFSDYELQLSREQLKAMLKRRGYNPDLSFAAFDGDRVVSFTFNGIGTFNGTPTAYDTGTGTLKEYRGRGLATKIFEYSIPYLREAGIELYLLEVLQHNVKAVSVYKNLGFETVRDFNYFIQKSEEINNETKEVGLPFLIRQMDIEELSSFTDFQDFYPSWQNSIESIKRADKDFIGLLAFNNNKDRVIGYCVFEPASGDITQIAVDREYRRKGAASLLLQEVIKLNKNNTVKVINTDVLCNSVTGFLEAKNIHVTGKQFEMVRKI